VARIPFGKIDLHEDEVETLIETLGTEFFEAGGDLGHPEGFVFQGPRNRRKFRVVFDTWGPECVGGGDDDASYDDAMARAEALVADWTGTHELAGLVTFVHPEVWAVSYAVDEIDDEEFSAESTENRISL
jgi:hypothetical protein